MYSCKDSFRSHSVVDHFPFCRETSSALRCPVYQSLVLIPGSGTLFRKSSHVPVSSRELLSVLSSCSFRTPGFKFDPFGVGFWSGYRHESNNFPSAICWPHCLFFSMYFCQILDDWSMCTLICIFYFVPLNHMSVFMPAPCCFDYDSSVLSLEIW